jgi:transglutaminase-like putative cysteine protease
VTVVVRPLVRGDSPYPRAPRGDDPLADALGRPGDQPAAVRRLAEELVHGRTDQVDASAAMLKWIALNVSHADEPPHDDSAAATLESRVGSCVGRSVLAVALHRAAGLPARTVHGLVVAPRHEPGPVGFMLHRFVETWIDGVGWVPSDPGDSVHVVDPLHVLIALDEEPYDPESQRDLGVVLAERLEPLAVDSAIPAGARRLVHARWMGALAEPPRP